MTIIPAFPTILQLLIGKLVTSSNMANICTRCGKERVALKTYTEKVETSMVTYTEFTCPDPECQKIVEEKLAKEKDIRTKNMTFASKGFTLGSKKKK